VETVSINGTDTAVQCAGSGPAVVLVPGAAGSSNTWRCVIAPGLPGHGRSAKPRATTPRLGLSEIGLRSHHSLGSVRCSKSS